MAPLRSLLNFCLDNRQDYGKINILYGARSSGDLCFTYEFDDWNNAPNTDLFLTIDREEEGWTKNVGFVPSLSHGSQAVTRECGRHYMRAANHDPNSSFKTSYS